MLEARRLALQQDIGTSCHLHDEGAIVGVMPTRTRRKQEGESFPDFYLAVPLPFPIGSVECRVSDKGEMWFAVLYPSIPEQSSGGEREYLKHWHVG